jgi:hypothetical protein
MIILTIILINLSWIAYSMADGFREGFYWHFRRNSRRGCDFEINQVFGLQRLLVILLISMFMMYSIGYLSIFISVCLSMIFSFFHNGTYYLTRNKLDDKRYPNKWKDESRTFPVFYSGLMSYRKRTILMVLGIVTEIFIYIFLLH